MKTDYTRFRNEGRYVAQCPNCASWTPVVVDQRTAVQGAVACCALPEVGR